MVCSTNRALSSEGGLCANRQETKRAADTSFVINLILTRSPPLVVLPVHRSIPRAGFLRGGLPGEPRSGYVLALRVENEPIAAHAMQVSEERLLVAREPEDPQRHRYADIDPDHPAVRMLRELTRIVAALREDHRPVGETAVVHDFQAVLETVHPL